MPNGPPERPNNSFKPKPLRYTKGMAEKACHAFGSTTRFGLTQALARMGPVSYAFGFLLIAGLAGQISLSNSFRFLPANRNIDHPSKRCRIFYRTMAFFMCAFWSFILTIALLGALSLKEHLSYVRDASETTKAAFVLLVPLPFTPVLYILYARFARWMARRENAR